MGINKSKQCSFDHNFDIFLDKLDGLKTIQISKIIKEFDHDGNHFIYYKFPNKITSVYNTIRINSLNKWKYQNICQRLKIDTFALKRTIIDNKIYYEKELYSNFLTLLLRYNSVQNPIYILVVYPTRLY